MVSIKTAVEIYSPDAGKIISFSIKVEVDAKKFYPFMSTDRKLERLLLPGRRSREVDRPLGRTSIFKTLAALHDEHVWGLVGRPAPNQRVQSYSKIPKAKFLMHEGAMFSINAPTVGDVAGITLSALVSLPGSQLLLEMSKETIDYLVAVAAYEYDHDTVTPKKRKSKIDMDNARVTECRDKGGSLKFLHVRVATPDGMKNKYIPATVATKSEAVAAARAFVNKSSPADGAADDEPTSPDQEGGSSAAADSGESGDD